ncbi:hypothetical protein [Enterococcus pallens]|uniref:DUF4868 domain-containing protein n=1 Tax=Enterococcus pallens ATCC BAA-351 TaxID=1158607 RepID=R2QLA4_9ENTE|nr:hypothetical protein [Enterococcus pallens]EOH97377.1 hypothetical protein UAU_00045 [Enterococcus pallens ATCC BAA-351]EOU21204.1 hypothetical protein I588_02051 [Enterococcus pallens ATCC BAA-351]OJG80591.1 hypothetical protein RV10_GL004328 [Enterococcus pallens]
MEIDICGVYLVEFKSVEKIQIKKLYIENKDLAKLSKEIKIPSQKRLPSFDSLGENIFSTSTRFRIEELEVDNYLFFLRDFYKQIINSDDDDNWLNSLDELFEEQKLFEPNVIIYRLIESNDNKEKECLYVSLFKNSMLMKDKTILFGKKKKKDKEMDVTEIGILEKRDVFILPEKDFICSIENFEGKIGLKVYRAIELDKLFSVTSLIDDYAEKKIRRFVCDIDEKKFKITNQHADVVFEDDLGNDRLMNVITEVISSDNINLKKTYASFSGRATKTIQKISLSRLEEVIEDLKEYVIDTQTDNLFTLDEIPRIDPIQKKMYVDERSVKIFAAMLNNEIIQKLLDGTIEIPYYQEI